MPVPPDHVCEAFQTPAETPILLGHAWDNGTKIGDMVPSQAAPTALWSAKVRAGLSVEGARVARPILSTDGRYTVAGWKASAWSQGELLRRVDETALLGLRLATSLREVSAPTANRDDIFARAEAAAWQETGEPYRDLSADTAYCVGHADLLAATIYHYLLPPVIVDLVPTAAPRPVGYTCALAIVDGLFAGVVALHTFETWISCCCARWPIVGTLITCIPTLKRTHVRILTGLKTFSCHGRMPCCSA